MSCQVSKRRQKASAPGEALSRSDQARVHRDSDTCFWRSPLLSRASSRWSCTLYFALFPCQILHIISTRHRIGFFASPQGDTLPVFPWWPNHETTEPDPSPRPKKCHVAYGRLARRPHTLGQCNIYTRPMTVCSPWVPRYPFIIHSFTIRVVRWSVRPAPHQEASCCACRGDARFKLKITLCTEAANQRRTPTVIQRPDPDQIRFVPRGHSRAWSLRVCS